MWMSRPRTSKSCPRFVLLSWCRAPDSLSQFTYVEYGTLCFITSRPKLISWLLSFNWGTKPLHSKSHLPGRRWFSPVWPLNAQQTLLWSQPGTQEQVWLQMRKWKSGSVPGTFRRLEIFQKCLKKYLINICVTLFLLHLFEFAAQVLDLLFIPVLLLRILREKQQPIRCQFQHMLQLSELRTASTDRGSESMWIKHFVRSTVPLSRLS